MTPHPAAYSRIADKRNLYRTVHPLVPEAHLLRERPLDEWRQHKSDWVFKPTSGNASHGVYRGDKVLFGSSVCYRCFFNSV